MLCNIEHMAKKEVLCPRCQKKTHFTAENPYRPFCSERCKLIDLGRWAAEEYKIPAEQSPSSENDELNAGNDEES